MGVHCVFYCSTSFLVGNIQFLMIYVRIEVCSVSREIIKECGYRAYTSRLSGSLTNNTFMALIFIFHKIFWNWFSQTQRLLDLLLFLKSLCMMKEILFRRSCRKLLSRQTHPMMSVAIEKGHVMLLRVKLHHVDLKCDDITMKFVFIQFLGNL